MRIPYARLRAPQRLVAYRTDTILLLLCSAFYAASVTITCRLLWFRIIRAPRARLRGVAAFVASRAQPAHIAYRRCDTTANASGSGAGRGAARTRDGGDAWLVPSKYTACAHVFAARCLCLPAIMAACFSYFL